MNKKIRTKTTRPIYYINMYAKHVVLPDFILFKKLYIFSTLLLLLGINIFSVVKKEEL